MSALSGSLSESERDADEGVDDKGVENTDGRKLRYDDLCGQ